MKFMKQTIKKSFDTNRDVNLVRDKINTNQALTAESSYGTVWQADQRPTA